MPLSEETFTAIVDAGCPDCGGHKLNVEALVTQKLPLLDGEVTVIFTPAVHSSGVDAGEGKPAVYGGNPNGFVIKIKDGPTLYHSGDTAYFSDMSLLADHGIDLALINIGGHFGMEPKDAARAAQATKAKYVVPHHYGTFGILTPDAHDFGMLLDAALIKHPRVNPGDSLTFVGRDLRK